MKAARSELPGRLLAADFEVTGLPAVLIILAILALIIIGIVSVVRAISRKSRGR